MPDTLRRNRLILVVTGFVVTFAVYVLAVRPWITERHFSVGGPIGRDFTNFWLGGRLALEGRLAMLTDFDAYAALLSETFGYGLADGFVFSYPPHILLVLAPLALLPYGIALALWSTLNLAAIAVAVRRLRGDATIATIACLSPAALTMVIFGHFGGALALAATVAFLDGERRPALAGACLALASVKPQFAAVLGVMLLATGRWRVVTWSVPFGAALFGVSVAAFGLAPWIGFFEETVGYHGKLLAQFQFEMLRTVVSLYAGLRIVDAPAWLAHGAQYAFSLLVLVRGIQVVRRDGLDARTLTLALLAVLAALPYVNGYDLVILAPALTIAMFAAPDDPALVPPAQAALIWLVPPLSIPFGLFESAALSLGFAASVGGILFAPRPGAAAAVAAVPDGEPARS